MREKSKKPRWSLSGSAGTGKTTLARALADVFDVPYLEEGFRRRLEQGLNPHSLSRHEHLDLLLELYDEALDEVRQACKDYGGFVADRSPVDYLAFWFYYGFAHEQILSEELAGRVERDLGYFGKVIVLPWGAIELESDGYRSANKWIQLHYQGLLEGLVKRRIPADKLLMVPDDLVTVETRLEWVIRQA
ncbi:AAA family ATPase [Kiloniella sp. b19]|uniref:AAA family ATPase n=1 Tax=Kiloniella sp. GXU_MW_B19 TaxID=3141326 RepID=UPI0031E1F56B